MQHFVAIYLALSQLRRYNAFMTVQENEKYYIHKLQMEFDRRKRVNPSFSLRSYARFLGVNAGTLWSVIRDHRPLPKAWHSPIIEKFNLKNEEVALFRSSASYKSLTISDHIKKKMVQKVLTDEIHKEVIEQWEYYAVLSLLKLKDFKSDSNWIAKRLGISKVRAQQVFNNLKHLNLILTDADGNFSQSATRFDTKRDSHSKIVQNAHLERLNLAKRALVEVSVQNRAFMTETFPINKKKLSNAKELIRDFKRKLGKYFETEPCDEVYNLNIQFFPLTKTVSKKGDGHEKSN